MLIINPSKASRQQGSRISVEPKEVVVFGQNPTPDEIFTRVERFLMRLAVFLVFLVGLYKIVEGMLLR